MKTFVIFFTGHYPVGAVGIARGVDLNDAVKKFCDALAKDEPILAANKDNSVTSLMDRAYEFDPREGDVAILLNGEY